VHRALGPETSRLYLKVLKESRRKEVISKPLFANMKAAENIFQRLFML